MLNNLPQNKAQELQVLKARRHTLIALLEQTVENNIETTSQFLGLIHNNIDELQREIKDCE